MSSESGLVLAGLHVLLQEIGTSFSSLSVLRQLWFITVPSRVERLIHLQIFHACTPARYLLCPDLRARSPNARCDC